MHASPLRRSAILTGGLALAALAAVPPATAGAPTAPHNQQVALVNGSDAQPEAKSHINGTAQVASYDGSSVVFSTDAALVPWDTNGTDDVYLRSVPDGITVLVSGTRTRIGDDASFEPTISDDGRYVAFTTLSTNLVKGTERDNLDVVVRDMQSTKMSLVSVSAAGKPAGRNSFFPVISGNGRFVSFQTFAQLGKKDRDRTEDVYVRDLASRTTRQASLLPRTGADVRGGVLNGDISDNGRLVTFGNDTSLWVRDMVKGATTRFHHEPPSAPCQPMPAGSAGRPVVSGNGKYVAFSSCAAALPGPGEVVDVFRVTLATGKVQRITAGNGHSYLPSLSRSGRFIGFGSEASDLVGTDDIEDQPDAFVADATTGTIVRASQTPDAIGGHSWSATTGAAISGDGHSLVYQTYADNLVPGDAYDLEEVLLWRDR